ncbi:uncharacterized protein LOC122563774 isoform X2 [Chiloscyllium plagiosum]|uniref:uncharacterized protein LOC122563774 isoform X2 n=1 Tax=Chiloscyllium plagiosum TaxID=36176 RepID=UPI001CB870A4|nr:uncharacterized protein LOC122563774 isoform X2 [Chiloscyllium plagiosum]
MCSHNAIRVGESWTTAHQPKVRGERTKGNLRVNLFTQRVVHIRNELPAEVIENAGSEHSCEHSSYSHVPCPAPKYGLIPIWSVIQEPLRVAGRLICSCRIETESHPDLTVAVFTITLLSQDFGRQRKKHCSHWGESQVVCVEESVTVHFKCPNVSTVTLGRDCGNVGIVGRDFFTHPSWKCTNAVTLGRSHSPALVVGRDSLDYPTCWNINVVTLERNHSPAPIVGKDSLNHPACLNTSEFTLGRDHSPVLFVGKDSLSHSVCMYTSGFILGRDHSPVLNVGKDSLSHPAC